MTNLAHFTALHMHFYAKYTPKSIETYVFHACLRTFAHFKGKKNIFGTKFLGFCPIFVTLDIFMVQIRQLNAQLLDYLQAIVCDIMSFLHWILVFQAFSRGMTKPVRHGPQTFFNLTPPPPHKPYKVLGCSQALLRSMTKSDNSHPCSGQYTVTEPLPDNWSVNSGKHYYKIG